MVRLAHLSDVHLYCAAHWTGPDWLSKRLIGWLNLRVFGRRGLFQQAEMILAAIMADIRNRRPECVVFSGDAGNLGFPEEFTLASRMLGEGISEGISGLAVPGNHDYYTRRAAASGDFERCFASWIEGECVDHFAYPFARRIGHVYLVGVCSSTGNRWFWDASGCVGREQRERLQRLLARPHIAERPKILVTHYPIAGPNCQKERTSHGLRDVDEVLPIIQAAGVSLWLHGHCHQPYFLRAGPSLPVSSICAGSGTQASGPSYFEYQIEGRRLIAERRGYDWSSKGFHRVDSFAVDL